MAYFLAGEMNQILHQPCTADKGLGKTSPEEKARATWDVGNLKML
jgi:hypothetical protein